jgi:hypothetical protein
MCRRLLGSRFYFLLFIDAPHIRSDASLSLRLMLGSIAGDNSAPKLCLFFAGLSDLGLTCLSDSQQSGNDFLTSVYVARWAEWVKGQGTADDAA